MGFLILVQQGNSPNSLMKEKKCPAPDATRGLHPGPGTIPHSGDWPAGDETINDHDHGDHEQKVDEPATDVHHESAQNPKNEQYHRDRPKHVCVLDEGWPAVTRYRFQRGNCRTVRMATCRSTAGKLPTGSYSVASF